MSDYYDHGGAPADASYGDSAVIRAELTAIQNGISKKLPVISGNSGKVVAVNAGATKLEAVATTGTGAIVRSNSPALSAPTGLVKGDVGLGNVDNTSDADKPVSTAQATAINAKANKGANNDITSLSGLTTALSIAQGGTGATSQSAARAALGSTATGDALFTTASATAARTTLDVYSKAEVPNQNIIDNSNFAINQRGVTGTVTLAAGAYGHDRWKAGSAGCTYTFAAATGITTITISAGSLVQVVEGSNLETATYTLSQSGTAQVRIVGGSYAASPIAVSATAGTNLSLEFGTGTVKQVKLEKGALATAWEFPCAQIDLLNCQRFAVKLLAGGSQETLGTGFSTSATVAVCVVPLPTTMRATPTAAYLSGGSSNLAFGSPVAGTINSITSVALGTDSKSLRIDFNGTGFTIGCSLIRQNSGTPILFISADL